MVEGCPFCNLQRLTEWYIDERETTGLVVCRDLHNKGYDMRLLAVIASPEGHRPTATPQQTVLMEQGLTRALQRMEFRKYRLVGIDRTQKSYPDHDHIQALLNQ